MNCLWKIKVPAAKTIDLMYKDFELESGCFNDRMTTVHQSFEKDIIECDTKVRDKKIPGDMVMIEFKSNGNVQKRGFHSVYKAVVMDAMKTTPKPGIKTLLSRYRSKHEFPLCLKGLFQWLHLACLPRAMSLLTFIVAVFMTCENGDNKGQPRDITCKACWVEQAL